MVFGFFARKKKKKEEPKDPIAAYDGLIEDLERQGSEIRKSAATLLSLRGELHRDVDKYQRRKGDMAARLKVAEEKGDGKASRVLRRDLEEAEQLLESSEKALVGADEDSTLLMDAARDLAQRVTELKAERNSARARLSVGLAVSGALRERSEKIEKVLALDAARDEVERAHALADIYREEVKK